MVTAGARSLGLVATLMTWGTAALAQSPSALVNPRTAEFDFPAAERSAIVAYCVEVFPSGSDTTSAQPLKVIYLAKSSPGKAGGLQVDFGRELGGLADGEYVATLKVVSRTGESPRSAPSEPFTLRGRASRPPPASAPAARTVPAPAPQSAPVAAEAKPDDEHHSRRWTIAFVVSVIALLATILH